MAGTPKKRARQLAAEALREAAAITENTPAGEPVSIPEATVLPEGARARARIGIRGTPSDTAAPRMPPPAKPAMGQRTREAVDRSQVSVMTELAQQLKPGLTVRIERLRPHWCAGWLEDYPLEAPDAMGDFYSYLREEHGGQYYRLTVLGAGEQQLYQAQVPIADRPKDRGRVIDRASFEGQAPVRVSNATTQPTAPAMDFSGVLGAATGFIQLILSQSEKTNAQTLSSVQAMVDAQQRQTSELTQAVLQVRADNAQPRQSFGEQLGEILEATRAVDNVRKALGGTSQRTGAANRGGDDDDDMRLLTQEAKRQFLGNMMGTMFAKPQQQRPAGAPVQRGPVAPVTPIRQQNRDVIRDAIPVSGQRPTKN